MEIVTRGTDDFTTYMHRLYKIQIRNTNAKMECESAPERMEVQKTNRIRRLSRLRIQRCGIAARREGKDLEQGRGPSLRKVQRWVLPPCVFGPFEERDEPRTAGDLSAFTSLGARSGLHALSSTRGSLHLDVHAHPGMDTALEMMCTFRQTRDLDLS
jgi:hypothetical protein